MSGITNPYTKNCFKLLSLIVWQFSQWLLIFLRMPVALVEKQKAKAIKQAKKLLQREGLLPPDEPLAS